MLLGTPRPTLYRVWGFGFGFRVYRSSEGSGALGFRFSELYGTRFTLMFCNLAVEVSEFQVLDVFGSGFKFRSRRCMLEVLQAEDSPQTMGPNRALMLGTWNPAGCVTFWLRLHSQY